MERGGDNDREAPPCRRRRHHHPIFSCPSHLSPVRQGFAFLDQTCTRLCARPQARPVFASTRTNPAMCTHVLQIVHQHSSHTIFSLSSGRDTEVSVQHMWEVSHSKAFFPATLVCVVYAYDWTRTHTNKMHTWRREECKYREMTRSPGFHSLSSSLLSIWKPLGYRSKYLIDTYI